MHKILILSLLLFLLAGSAEAQQTPWKYYSKIDEMTGEKDYRIEKVITHVNIEDTEWRASLMLFCGDGQISFSVRSKSRFEEIKLDTFVNAGGEGATEFRLKWDNNEPVFNPWIIDSNSPGTAWSRAHSSEELDWLNDIRKQIIKGMIKYRRLWIEFKAQGRPTIAKFDLTGFSRELAKCSRIPDTN